MRYDPSVPMPWMPTVFLTLFALALGILLTFYPHKLGVHDWWKVEEKLFGRRWVMWNYRVIGILCLAAAAFGLFLLCYVAVVKLL